MKSKRVIIDTNLWISFLISNKLNELDSLIDSGAITLIFSNELIEEFLEVTSRPKFKKYFKKNDIDALLNQIQNHGQLIKVKSNMNICRDEKDDFLLNLSIDSKADYLITGDNDLLILGKIKRTNIISWSDFLSKF
ncbi:putative toxin-antitoxin system toxin component, PIN family [Marivirga sp.]|uniref:putative toxin-antitoxin system toxin component, PIN family n=1 Tax=Marivirga sp. TaxID=2018662 RepID=UPI002D7F1FCF|nr:putative toxin-antitoxin system toxin component, PIN family [Marivirga sp.]HET8859006.1 putative toxin-antitoxin system toxin component, PIN family [Marivirga sp.]